MSKLTWRTFIYDIVLNIKTYHKWITPRIFNVILRRPLVVIHKIVAYEGIINLNFSRSFKKKSALKEFLTDPQKTAAIIQDVAFIFDKAALEHSLFSWLALDIGSSWYSQVDGSTWYVLQHWTLLDYQPTPGTGIRMTTEKEQEDRAKRVFWWWAEN